MKPSILKIVSNDHAACLLAMGGPILLAIACFRAAFDSAPRPTAGIFLYVGTGILTMVLLYFLYRRISYITYVFASGIREGARVTDIGFIKDRGRIEFEYSHNGQPYQAGTGIMKNKQTTAIAKGDTIEIAIDPANLKKAFVVSLYCA